MLVGASIHDYEHPGTNNAYQTNSLNYFSMQYNDRSVLEMHHLSASFLILSDEHYNMFSNLSVSDFRSVRQCIIDYVLSTDTSTHSLDLANLSTRIKQTDFSLSNPQDKRLTSGHIARAAYLSNPFKSWEIAQQWSLRLMDEFF